MKAKRQNKIREIIENNIIETQDELLARLEADGLHTTQATISRDIREMRLTKVSGENGRQKYTVIPSADTDVLEKYHQVLNAGILNIDYAENLIVIRTVSGMAMAVAAALDNLKLPEVMGCIAGDDTIFCAVRGSQHCKNVIEQIKKVVSDE